VDNHHLGGQAVTATKLRFTLDTSCVIHAVANQRYASDVNELAERCRNGEAELWLTAAFHEDQATAGDGRRAANLRWIAGSPVITAISQPFRIENSPVDDRGSVLVDERTKDACGAIEAILLPGYRRQTLDSGNEEQMRKWRKRIIDVQHLASHFMSGHDVFVTSDDDDMLRKRDRLWRRTGIVIESPNQAVKRLG
jgi:hypothetical protein